MQKELGWEDSVHIKLVVPQGLVAPFSTVGLHTPMQNPLQYTHTAPCQSSWAYRWAQKLHNPWRKSKYLSLLPFTTPSVSLLSLSLSLSLSLWVACQCRLIVLQTITQKISLFRTHLETDWSVLEDPYVAVSLQSSGPNSIPPPDSAVTRLYQNLPLLPLLILPNPLPPGCCLPAQTLVRPVHQCKCN